jgi:amino acid transporter
MEKKERDLATDSGSNAPAADIINPMTGQHHLAKGVLNTRQVLFCCVTGAAPISAMLFNGPVGILGAGWAVPGAFILATIVLTIFSVGYIEMARRVTAAGGFYSFISHAFGSVMGMGTAILMTFCYLVFSAAVTGVTSYFFSANLMEWFGWDIPVWIFLFGTIILMTAFMFFHIEVTARILGIALVAELAVLLIFSVAVLVQGGGPDGLVFESLNPLAVFDSGGNMAIVAGATGIALFAAFWSWVGFEMAPNYAEEAKEPKKVMAPAMYVSVIGLGVLYVFVMWMFVAAAGKQGSADLVNQQYAGEIASIFYPMSDQYVGGWLTTLFGIFIITGSFACQMAFFNTGCRYLFSMGREGVLPSALGKTHPKHKSPHVAGVVAGLFVTIWVGAFFLYDPTTLGALLKLGTWSPLLGVAGILAIQALVSVAIIYYFLTKAKDGFHWFKTLVAPIAAAITQAYAVYLRFKFRGDLSGAADVPFIQYLWVWPIVIFAIGVVIALVLRATNPQKYAGIGRYLHEDVPAS